MINTLTTKRPVTCLSDLRIDAYFAEELSEHEQQVVREHARGCARCAALLREREQERAAYLCSAPALALQSELRRRGSAKRRRSLGWGMWATASSLSVAAVLLLMVLPRTGSDDDDGTRTKGAPHLGFFVKHGQQVRRGSDGERVQPGDQLRFTYSSARSLYLTILSIDAAGQASEYHPRTRVAPGRSLALESSVELDATLGPERVYGVFCQDPVATAELLTALEKASSERTGPKGCTVDVVNLIKGPKN